MYRNHSPFSLRTALGWCALALCLGGLELFGAGGVVKLAWDPNTEPDLAGYRIKYGTSPGVYTTTLNVGNTTAYSVSGLTPLTPYYFVVTAYNASDLESPPSIEVSGTPGSGAPTALAASVVVEEDTSKEIILTGTDPVGAPLTFTVLTSPARGVLTGSAPNLFYNPNANYFGPDSFTFRVNNGSLDSAPATISITVNPGNDPPSMTEIGPQSVKLGSSTPEIAFTISDIDDTVGTLGVTVDSSNLAVVPLSAITLGGTGASRTVQVSAASLGPVGVSTLTLTVTDPHGAPFSRTFVINVIPDNNPPTIESIGNKSMAEDQELTFDFNIGDVETPVSSLILAAHSTDQTVVPDANITFSGTGSSRRVSIKPLADRSGTLSIVVSVTDAGPATVSSTFSLTVNPVNDAPKIIDPGLVVVFEDSTAFIPIFITDVDSGPGALTLSATSASGPGIPSTSVRLEGSGGLRTLVVTPAPNQYGHSSVTLVAGDGEATFTLTVPIRVDAVYDRPTLGSITDQTTPEKTPLVLPLVVTNPDAPFTSLRMEATSSDIALIPSDSVVVSPFFNQVTISPNPSGGFGTSRITLNLFDEVGLASSTSFNVAVANVNEAPTISGIPNQSALEGAATEPIPFTIGDPDGSLDELRIFVNADNQSILPADAFVIAGTGKDRTLTLLPVLNATGTTKVTVTVSDGLLSASTAFDLSVSPVNLLPEVSIPTTSRIRVSGRAGSTVVLPDPILVYDRESQPEQLLLLASSSDIKVIPEVRVLPGDQPISRKIQLRLGNRSGAVPLSILVLDQEGLTARFSFEVEVLLAGGADTPNVGRDFTSDGSSTLLLQSADGQLAAWFLRGASLVSGDFFQPTPLSDPDWRLFSSADFDGDGKADLAFQHSNGSCAIWHMDGLSLRPLGAGLLVPSAPLGAGFKAVAAADFNGDGKPDLIFQNAEDGRMHVAYMNDTSVISTAPLAPDRASETGWRVAGAADFDQDGKADLVLEHRDGRVAIWYMDGRTLIKGALISASLGTSIVAVSDFNGDGSPDLIDQDLAGQLSVRLMNGALPILRTPITATLPGPEWKAVGPR